MIFKYIAILFVAITVLACDATGQKQVKLENIQDSVAYCIGLQIYGNSKKDSLFFNPDIIAAAMRSAADGDSLLISEESIAQVFQNLQVSMSAKQMESKKKLSAENEKAGKAFLADNKKKPGVKVTASGLQYEVIKEGNPNGKQPTLENTVKVHYEGKLLNGNIFDSSIQRGEPIEFPLNNVIVGWKEGLQLMKEGAKYKLYIPANLAYGEQEMPGGQIPPNSTLVFDVELIEVK